MDLSLQEVKGLRLAVEGCGHGTLHAIYASVEKACQERGWGSMDLLIIGGDFQANRNAFDMNVMSVPAKYRELADFHEYYSGSRIAPYPTIFVGGNHEASSHMWELYYGGWVAPNIYYMGAANVLRVGPVRIAGMSGIWKGYNYGKHHHERLPYNGDDIKSIYHIRELDVRKLLQLRTQVDVGISHDWPRAIEKHGDQSKLWRMKPDFEQESKDGTLGNLAAKYVMDRLRPPYWFAAHLHCKYAATKDYAHEEAPQAAESSANVPVVENPIQQPASTQTVIENPDEIDLGLSDDEETAPQPDNQNSDATKSPANGLEIKEAPAGVSDDLRAQLPASFSKPMPVQRTTPGQPIPPTIQNKTVRFLALDKCLPGRKFLQLLELEPCSKSIQQSNTEEANINSDNISRYKLEYDPEWLAITRAFAGELILGDRTAPSIPDLGETSYLPLIQTAETWIEEHVTKAGKLTIPENFTLTAPIHVPGMPERVQERPLEYTNPQTAAFCELVGIENKFHATDEERQARMMRGPAPEEQRRDGQFGGGRERGGRGGGWGGGRDGGRGGGRGRGGGGRGGGFRGRGRGRGY